MPDSTVYKISNCPSGKKYHCKTEQIIPFCKWDSGIKKNHCRNYQYRNYEKEPKSILKNPPCCPPVFQVMKGKNIGNNNFVPLHKMCHRIFFCNPVYCHENDKQCGKQNMNNIIFLLKNHLQNQGTQMGPHHSLSSFFSFFQGLCFVTENQA